MTVQNELFDRIKRFLRFDDSDVANLTAIAPIIEKHGPAVTDAFYEQLLAEPATADLIEGQVDKLKKTHHAWMQGLAAGDYGEQYFESRWRIGVAHVRVGISPYWVEASVSSIRTGLIRALAQELTGVALVDQCSSVIKICDLDLMIINLSYAEERIDRLTKFTGMKRSLLENIIRLDKR